MAKPNTTFIPAPAGWRNVYVNPCSGHVLTPAMPGWLSSPEDDNLRIVPTTVGVRGHVYEAGHELEGIHAGVIGPGDEAPALSDNLLGRAADWFVEWGLCDDCPIARFGTTWYSIKFDVEAQVDHWYPVTTAAQFLEELRRWLPAQL